MYKIVGKKVDGTEEALAVSKNYRLAKRVAKNKVVKDLAMFMGDFFLYDNDTLKERGSIVTSRISWEDVGASTKETLSDSDGAVSN
jgi:hypothetical protein